MVQRHDKHTKRIVLTGPESTGKSWLSKKLASEFKTLWIPEYARFYIKNLAPDYKKKDVIHIAEMQIALEKEISKFDYEYLFIDTSLIITKVWLEHVFGSSPSWIDDYLKQQTNTFYLLCYYDLPWIHDPLRENKDLRAYFYQWYEKELNYYGFDYRIVAGEGNKRLSGAEIAIQSF